MITFIHLLTEEDDEVAFLASVTSPWKHNGGGRLGRAGGGADSWGAPLRLEMPADVSVRVGGDSEAAGAQRGIMGILCLTCIPELDRVVMATGFCCTGMETG